MIIYAEYSYKSTKKYMFPAASLQLYRWLNEEYSSIIFIPELLNWLQMKVAQTNNLWDLPSVQYPLCESFGINTYVCTKSYYLLFASTGTRLMSPEVSG